MRHTHLVASIALFLLSTTTQVSDVINRRKFLRQVGAVGFGAGMLVTVGSTVGYRPALASGDCNSPCGPSPLCSDSICGGSDKERRRWGSLECTDDRTEICWFEDYCGEPPSQCLFTSKYACCDYCHPDGGGQQCDFCPSPGYFACICRTTYSC